MNVDEKFAELSDEELYEALNEISNSIRVESCPENGVVKRLAKKIPENIATFLLIHLPAEASRRWKRNFEQKVNK